MGARLLLGSGSLAIVLPPWANMSVFARGGNVFGNTVPVSGVVLFSRKMQRPRLPSLWRPALF